MLSKRIYEKMQKNTDELMGMTPLHEAAGKGEFELCKQIINNVQNKNPKCHYGFTHFITLLGSFGLFWD